MKRMLLGLVAAIAAGTSFGATVTVSSTGNYGTIQNYTNCTTSPASTCANFLPTQNVSGTFTTSGALPASANNVEIGSTVTSYSFTSGLDTVASTDTNARLNSLRVTTDASGNITGINMQAVQWTTGSAPHTTANRLNAVTLSGTNGAGIHNSGCQVTGTGSSGVADTCLVTTAAGTDTSRSTTVLASGGSCAAILRVSASAGSGVSGVPGPSTAEWEIPVRPTAAVRTSTRSASSWTWRAAARTCSSQPVSALASPASDARTART